MDIHEARKGNSAVHLAYRRDYDAAYEQEFKRAAAAERVRLGTIMLSEAALGRYKLAHRLAFDTCLPASEVLAILEESPRAGKKTRPDHEARRARGQAIVNRMFAKRATND